ncbi:MAG: hypothetical protein QOK05_2003 [Chloroflexota bacterium]|nr:hypothetical protein [Chloroflexota bacterium]
MGLGRGTWGFRARIGAQGRVRRAALPAALALTSLILTTTTVALGAPLRPGGDVVIKVLSNRADLVSGGDALVQVLLPAGVDPAGAKIEVDGRDVTSAFAADRLPGLLTGIPTPNNTGIAPGTNSLLGTLRGLKVGENVIRAILSDGYGARITVTNHPIGGPVFSGPQVQPWICTTSANALGAPTDAQCNAPTTYTYKYKDATTGQMNTYDPNSPPSSGQVATTTTDQGNTVPYIVRDERGVIDRGIYDIAVLDDPSKPWTPWTPQPGWNHKLGFTFGASCAPGHSQGSAASATDDLFLSRGYMKAVSTLNVNGTSCNGITQAESLMMIKEHIVEAYGPIRFTMGDGCSGGAEAQHNIADMYPGLLDGIRPECDFPDFFTPAIWEKYDCQLFTAYFNAAAAMWPALDQAAVTGGPLTPGDCAEQTVFNAGGIGGAADDWQPDGIGCNADGPWKWNATTNPHGTRCTLQDYNVNALGTRAADGYANRPIDNVGVEWGLQALKDGTISAAQFVDLNSKIGDLDINFQPQPQRAQGDLAGIIHMYQTAQISYTANWAKIPEIDARADDSYDEHSNVMRAIDRARIDQAVGSHASQVFWTEPSIGAFGAASSQTHALSFTVMDAWLSNIEKDTSSNSQQAKVVMDKPAEALDACVQSGQFVNQSLCDVVQTTDVLPVNVAGAPTASNVLKCQLKPLDRADYPGVTFTDAQWSDLQTAFPSGVCDWTKPGVGQQPPIGDWLTFAGVVGGTPLGAAPLSVPFGPSTAADQGIPNTGTAPPAPGAVPLLGVVVLLLVGFAIVARPRRREH